MSRPKRVYLKSLSKFNLLHTQKVKMFSGVEMTALHLVKETQNFFISIDSWAFCCSTYKKLKFGTQLEVNIPIIEDEKIVSFFETHAWHDRVDKELKDNDSDMVETIQLLDRLFPEKKKVFFYELKSLIAAYSHGSFIRYNKDGEIEKPYDHDYEHRSYYNNKYNGMLGKGDIVFPDNVIKLLEDYHNTIKDDTKDDEYNKDLKHKAYLKYREASDKFLNENHDLTTVFKTIGENSIVCPYIYTHCCVAGSSYENAGEIYMVVTNDAVYFDAERHF